MKKLVIREFSLQAQTEFERHIPEEQAELSALADRMLSAFPYVIRAEDILLFSETKLYDYRLAFKLFNGSADATLSSKNIALHFRDGRTEQALTLVSKSIDQIYKIFVNRPTLVNQLTFSAQAQFDSPEAYSEYMAQFTKADLGYLSGGKIIQAEARNLSGELRLLTEKSAMFENGLFLSVQFYTKEGLTSELMEMMAKRFIEVAGYEGIELAFPK